jgi:ABC-type lipoprotein export system ATPase subunit
VALIQFKDITKTYILGSEPVHALKGISLAIEQGEYVAIMAPLALVNRP